MEHPSPAQVPSLELALTRVWSYWWAPLWKRVLCLNWMVPVLPAQTWTKITHFIRAHSTLHSSLRVTGPLAAHWHCPGIYEVHGASVPCPGSWVSPGKGMIVSMGTVEAPWQCLIVEQNGRRPEPPARTAGSCPRIEVMGQNMHNLLIWNVLSPNSFISKKSETNEDMAFQTIKTLVRVLRFCPSPRYRSCAPSDWRWLGLRYNLTEILSFDETRDGKEINSQ